MGRVEQSFAHRESAPFVLLALDLVFALHRLLLPFDVVGIEPWCDEKLCETVEGFGQAIRLQFEVVGGVVARGISAAASAVFEHEVGEAIDLRILLGGNEQHVFDEVGESLMRVGIMVAAASHASRASGPVTSGGVDEEGAQVVRQHDMAVFAVVDGTLDGLQRAGCLAGC